MSPPAAPKAPQTAEAIGPPPLQAIAPAAPPVRAPASLLPNLFPKTFIIAFAAVSRIPLSLSLIRSFLVNCSPSLNPAYAPAPPAKAEPVSLVLRSISSSENSKVKISSTEGTLFTTWIF